MLKEEAGKFVNFNNLALLFSCGFKVEEVLVTGATGRRVLLVRNQELPRIKNFEGSKQFVVDPYAASTSVGTLGFTTEVLRTVNSYVNSKECKFNEKTKDVFNDLNKTIKNPELDIKTTRYNFMVNRYLSKLNDKQDFALMVNRKDAILSVNKAADEFARTKEAPYERIQIVTEWDQLSKAINDICQGAALQQDSGLVKR